MIPKKNRKWNLQVNSDVTCYFSNYEIILILNCLDQIVSNKEVDLDNIDSEDEIAKWKNKILARLSVFYKMFLEELKDLIS